MRVKRKVLSYNDSNNILLPYWRTIKGKDGEIDLYQGDIFQLTGNKFQYKYVVRYHEREACFMYAEISELKYEKLWGVWKSPDSTWWDKFQKGMVYLGNENTNPELLEEK